ncbi:MAG: FAD:protein FMN transferase [Acidobacteria bacterium]|nr:MAG: FAD:protein FMN transferase [Acidobacteriota bacterium]
MHSPMRLSQPCPKRRSDEVLRTVALMGTFVTIHVVGHVVGHEGDPGPAERSEKAVDRAFEWFCRVEECCTRFEAQSEVMQLTTRVGAPVRVSAILYEAVQFALAVAEESDGAFDPTVGYAMEERGFNREYRTGKTIRTALDFSGSVNYRDVRLDADRKTITLLRPLILDLGAVAKGLAVDLAARELRPCKNFAINAGGDLFLGGCNPDGQPWSIGIRHPRSDDELIDSVRISNRAVCTSGDYERRSSKHDGHHILDPRTGSSANAVASVTVIAPTAMLADALATAAFSLGPAEGMQLFDRLGVDGLIISPELEQYATRGMRDYH